MATAVVHALRPAGSPLFPGQSAYVASCVFWGADVPVEIRGQVYDVLVQLTDGYTLGDLKNALGQAVGAQATELGLSLNAGDIDLPGFEHAPP